MAIVEIKPSDTHERMVDKINFNFNSLSSQGNSSSTRIVQVVENGNQITLQINTAIAKLTSEVDKQLLDLQNLLLPVGGAIIVSDEDDPRLGVGVWEEITVPASADGDDTQLIDQRISSVYKRIA